MHNEKYTPYYIAKLIDAKTCMVVGILKRNNIEPNVGDPHWNRLINRMPDFPFDDYQSLVDFCKEEYSRGVKIYKISKQLRISEDMVNTAVFLK